MCEHGAALTRPEVREEAEGTVLEANDRLKGQRTRGYSLGVKLRWETAVAGLNVKCTREAPTLGMECTGSSGVLKSLDLKATIRK